MGAREREFKPPFCPNPACEKHLDPRSWRFKRIGFYSRRAAPHRIQRFLCGHCRRSFSSQTFSTSYWLKRPDLLVTLFWRTLGCSGFRQIARELRLSPTTVARQVARLGRHCLLFHERHRPRGALSEPLVVDGFGSFEYSQYHPFHFNVAVGAQSHFFYGFTDAPLRRSGRMRPEQKRRRAELEAREGRPDPRAVELEMAELVRLVVGEPSALVVRSDEHRAYPRAFRRLEREGYRIRHERTPSRAARTPQNPLFPVNLLDLLIRHDGANHKRETLAFSRRRQSAAERLAILQVWRNYVKPFSERRQDQTPAQRLGLLPAKLTPDEALRRRIFPSRVRLPARLARYYRREVETAPLGPGLRHRLRYAC